MDVTFNFARIPIPRLFVIMSRAVHDSSDEYFSDSSFSSSDEDDSAYLSNKKHIRGYHQRKKSFPSDKTLERSMKSKFLDHSRKTKSKRYICNLVVQT